MKLLELKNLFEIKMSPSALRDAVSSIDARAGMEFEMIIPNAAQEDEDYDMEPDYDQDERIRSLEDIRRFFYDSDYNSRREVDSFIDRIMEDYWGSDWLDERKKEEWEDAELMEILLFVRDNYGSELREQAEEEVAKQTPEFGVNDEEFRAAVDDLYEKLLKEKRDKISADGGEDYDEAFEKWEENDWQETANNDEMITDWLFEEGIRTMSELQSSYSGDISWPYYTSSSPGGEISIEEVADEFKQAIGRPVNYSHNYHGGKRAENTYVVEPDGSLEPDDERDGGLEFVSPPLPISELLDDLKKVKEWAKDRGAYTNESTGLHINVSVPGWQGGNIRDLDYVKLALLLGDQYVLDQFGRSSNTYAKSALDIVKNHVRQRPEDAAALLNAMREHLNTAAAKAIHSGVTNKYTSINTKDGYIEFRSPGGDWLGDNFDKIETTLLRFVVAMDAAVDENKYKEEYAKKLYKLLSPVSEDPGVVELFSNYGAGLLDKSSLIRQVRGAQLQRQVKKGPTGAKYWWSVSRPGYAASVEVVAASKEEAIEKGRTEYPDWAAALNITAKPIKPYDSTPVRATAGAAQPAGSVGGEQRFTGRWKVLMGGRQVFTVQGENQSIANAAAREWLSQRSTEFLQDHQGEEVEVVPIYQ